MGGVLSVDLSDFTDSLQREVQPPGTVLFAGVSDDTPLAAMWAALRTLRIADGPDEVHIRSVARTELKPYFSHGDA